MKNRRSLFFLLMLIIVAALLTGCAIGEKRRSHGEKTRMLGEAYMAENNLPLAYSQFAKALELTPNDPYLHFDLGLFYYRKNDFEKAAQAYQRALEIKPDFASAINNLGIVYLAQKKWDRAIERLSPITENYAYATPHYPHYLIGQAYYQKGDYAAAIQHFREALNLKPEFTPAQHWLGRAYLGQGKTAQAIQSLQSAAKQVPQAAFIQLDLGRAYKAAGNRRQAIQAFDRAAALAAEFEASAIEKTARREKQLLQ